jgi:rRNA-processing protein FCF1
VDIFSALNEKGYTKFIVPDKVMKELDKIDKTKIIKKLLNDKTIENITLNKKHTDTAILEYAVKHRIAVATNDKALIKKLKKEQITVVRLRQKKYLVEE